MASWHGKNINGATVRLLSNRPVKFCSSPCSELVQRGHCSQPKVIMGLQEVDKLYYLKADALRSPVSATRMVRRGMEWSVESVSGAQVSDVSS